MKRVLVLLMFFLLLTSTYATAIEKTWGGYINYKYLGSGKLVIKVELFALSHVIDTTTKSIVLNVKVNKTTYQPKLDYSTVRVPSNKCISANVQSAPNNPIFREYEYKCTLDLTSAPLDTALKNDSLLYLTVEVADQIGGIAWGSTLSNIPFLNFTTCLNIKELQKDDIGMDFPLASNFVITSADSTTSYTPGGYPSQGDSVYYQLLSVDTDSRGVNAVYKYGLSGDYPVPTICPSPTSWICSANLSRKPYPSGFYFNCATGECTFFPKWITSPNWIFAPFHYRVSMYRKNSTGNWMFRGYSSIVIAPFLTGENVGNISANIPAFELPKRVDVCESDTANITITTRKLNVSFKDSVYVKLEGNLSSKNYSYTVDYTTISQPIIKLKVWSNPGDSKITPAILSLRLGVGKNGCWGGMTRTQSMQVVFRKPLQAMVTALPGPCNGITAKALDGNSGLSVNYNWQIYKDSFQTKPIKTEKSSVVVITGLTKSKYYFLCKASTTKAYCREQTYYDTVDMQLNWPKLDFQLNRNTVCAFDTNQYYYAKGVTGFTGKLKYQWDVDSMVFIKDTLNYDLYKPSKVVLRLQDTVGCDYTKTFYLTADSLLAIKITDTKVMCGSGNQTVELESQIAGYKPLANWLLETSDGVKYSHDQDTSMSYYYSAAQNRITAEVISGSGCRANFEATVKVDTTRFYKDSVVALCKSSDSFVLSNIKIKPTGGFWKSEQGGADKVSLKQLGSYPKTINAYYYYQSTLSSCGFIDTQRLQVMDTVKTVYSNKVLLCKELAQTTLNTAFNPKNTSGEWLEAGEKNQLGSNVKMGEISPKNTASGIYQLYYRYNESACSNEDQYTLEIKPRIIALEGSSSVVVAKENEVIQFNTQNTLGGNTSYRWEFGDSIGGVKTTSTLANPQHSYAKKGIYFPVVYGSLQGCEDSLHLPAIKVEVLGVNSIDVNKSYWVSPNPFKDELNIQTTFNVSDVGIKVWDSQGRMVLEQAINHWPCVVHTEKWSAGIYQVQIVSPRKTTIVRVLKAD